MKNYRFIGALATAFFLSTGLAFSQFTKEDIDLHAKGDLVADTGSHRNTADCWNRPYGFHCTMHTLEKAELRFHLPKVPGLPFDGCIVNVTREPVYFKSRFDVKVYAINSAKCRVHKINDNDFWIEGTK